MNDPDQLARAEDEDFRAERGELGEEEYAAKRAKADKQARYDAFVAEGLTLAEVLAGAAGNEADASK